MKKAFGVCALAMVMWSCGSTQGNTLSQASQAANLLASLSSNSTIQQISQLFTLLDTDKSDSLSKSEAIGQVSDNFDTLDNNKDSSLSLNELGGLLALLKK